MLGGNWVALEWECRRHEGAGVQMSCGKGYDALKRATVARQWRQGLGTLEI